MWLMLAGCASDPSFSGSLLDLSAPGDGGPRDLAGISLDAAGGSDLAVDPNKPNCKYQAQKTGLNAYQQVGGLSFHVYAPTSYDPAVAHRVVVLMHGQDSDGTPELNALWKSIADAEQLVVLVPKGSRPSTNPSSFPDGANWAVADLNNVQDLVTDLDDCYSTDPHRRILWGFSEGTFYGYLLGIGATGLFAGLAMGGGDTSFARSYGYPPSAETWHVPVSHVQGTTDPNGTAGPMQDQLDFQAAGSTFTLYLPMQGHTITQAQVMQQYQDLKGSVSP